MYDVYRNNFAIKSAGQVNAFVDSVLAISNKYLNYLVSKNRIYIPLDLSVYDCSVDLLAELFKIENNCFTRIEKYFSSLENKPRTEEEYNHYLKTFIYTCVQNSLADMYKHSDPVTYKIIRNIKYAIDTGNYKTTVLLTGKYIHTKEIDFNEKDTPDRNDLLKIIQSTNGHASDVPGFLKKVFNILDNQNNYLSAVSLMDLAFIYKELYVFVFTHQLKSQPDDFEGRIMNKFFVEDVKHSFYPRLEEYFTRKRFSEKEALCMYDIVEEILENIQSGIERESVNSLAKKHFSVSPAKYFNKVEYVIELLNSTIVGMLNNN